MHLKASKVAVRVIIYLLKGIVFIVKSYLKVVYFSAWMITNNRKK